MIDINRALTNPASVFHTPEEVLQAEALSRADKIKCLQQWEYDARELAVAAEENMAGEDTDFLRRILKALRELGVEIDSEHSSAGKHGACDEGQLDE